MLKLVAKESTNGLDLPLLYTEQVQGSIEVYKVRTQVASIRPEKRSYSFNANKQYARFTSFEISN